jgi:hypothetical protein
MATLMAKDASFSFEATTRRYNDWIHSLRGRGIGQARGRYLRHLNADNIIYPHALVTLHAYSQMASGAIKGKGRQSRAAARHLLIQMY